MTYRHTTTAVLAISLAIPAALLADPPAVDDKSGQTASTGTTGIFSAPNGGQGVVGASASATENSKGGTGGTGGPAYVGNPIADPAGDGGRGGDGGAATVDNLGQASTTAIITPISATGGVGGAGGKGGPHDELTGDGGRGGDGGAVGSWTAPVNYIPGTALPNTSTSGATFITNGAGTDTAGTLFGNAAGTGGIGGDGGERGDVTNSPTDLGAEGNGGDGGVAVTYVKIINGIGAANAKAEAIGGLGGASQFDGQAGTGGHAYSIGEADGASGAIAVTSTSSGGAGGGHTLGQSITSSGNGGNGFASSYGKAHGSNDVTSTATAKGGNGGTFGSGTGASGNGGNAVGTAAVVGETGVFVARATANGGTGSAVTKNGAATSTATAGRADASFRLATETFSLHGQAKSNAILGGAFEQLPHDSTGAYATDVKGNAATTEEIEFSYLDLNENLSMAFGDASNVAGFASLSTAADVASVATASTADASFSINPSEFSGTELILGLATASEGDFQGFDSLSLSVKVNGQYVIGPDLSPPGPITGDAEFFTALFADRVYDLGPVVANLQGVVDILITFDMTWDANAEAAGSASAFGSFLVGTSGATAVPEPAGLCVASLLVSAGLLRRRRRIVA